MLSYLRLIIHSSIIALEPITITTDHGSCKCPPFVKGSGSTLYDSGMFPVDVKLFTNAGCVPPVTARNNDSMHIISTTSLGRELGSKNGKAIMPF
jgi:hypothetical protein